MSNPFFSFFKQTDIPQRYLGARSIAPVKSYVGTKMLPLPTAEPLSTDLSDTIRLRRTSNRFTKHELRLAALSQLLYWSVGEMALVPGRGTKSHRAYPSGGAKYPIEFYLAVKHVEGLESGLYHYRPDWHAIEQVAALTSDELVSLETAVAAEWFAAGSLSVWCSFILERGAGKYGALVYKLGLIEAGHVAQNFSLVSTALGLGCGYMGDFNAEPLQAVLQLDGYNETLCHAIAIGSKYE